MRASTIKEIQFFWNNFASEYKNIEQHMNTFSYSLMNMLKFENKKNILEVAAGTGFLFDHYLKRKQTNSVYTATDLSENMLDILCKRHGVEFSTEKPSKVDHLNLRIQQANSEQLPFENDKFDCYVANLCLMITPNPEIMLQESFRVLEEGGVAGFSVWGDVEKSNFFTFLPSVLQSLGLSPQNEPIQVRSNFHLNDRAYLISLLEKAGFINIVCWNQFIPTLSHQSDIENMLNFPQVKSILQVYPDKKDEIRTALLKKFEEIVIKGKYPIGVDGLLIIGQKPKGQMAQQLNL